MSILTYVDGRRPEVASSTEGLPRVRRLVLRLVLLLLLAGSGGLTIRSTLKPAAPPPVDAAATPIVTVSVPLQRRLAASTDFVGQFSAVDRVEIRAQVGGYLTEIRFKDGQFVKKGDLLFVIDPRPFEIAMQNARAQLATAQAVLSLSNKQLSRTTDLLRSEFASRERLDQRTQEQQAAEAAIEQAKAAIRAAELNLEWTRITAPISGRIGVRCLSVGNLVVGGQSGGATSLLTTIVSLDPIYLDFDMGEADYVAYRRHLRIRPDGPELDRTAGIALSDEEGWTRKGQLDFLDNELNRSSGTVRARATVPNGDLFVAPGQFARLHVPTAPEADALLVPEAALSADQSHTLLMTVSADGIVVPKDVQVGPSVGGLRVVIRGIGPEDRVVINGLIFARPGSKVTPQPGQIADVRDRS